MNCVCKEDKDGKVISLCGAHLRVAREAREWVPLPEDAQTPRVSHVVRDVQDLHPLQHGDRGHFLCVVATDRGIYSVHGIVTASSAADFQARVMEPAGAQLAAMITE
jgi:hypothetical protein